MADVGSPTQSPQGGPPPGASGEDLHSIAVDAQSAVSKLAIGLAHLGAAPQAVSTLQQMGNVLTQVVKQLGAAPLPGVEQQAGPPQPQQGPPPGAAPGGPSPQQQQSPAPAETAQHHSLQAATHSLHAAMIASKARAEAQAQGAP